MHPADGLHLLEDQDLSLEGSLRFVREAKPSGFARMRFYAFLETVDAHAQRRALVLFLARFNRVVKLDEAIDLLNKRRRDLCETLATH